MEFPTARLWLLGHFGADEEAEESEKPKVVQNLIDVQGLRVGVAGAVREIHVTDSVRQ